MHAKLSECGRRFYAHGKLICRAVQSIVLPVHRLLRPCRVCVCVCVANVCEYLHVQNISAAYTPRTNRSTRQSIEFGWEIDGDIIHIQPLSSPSSSSPECLLGNFRSHTFRFFVRRSAYSECRPLVFGLVDVNLQRVIRVGTADDTNSKSIFGAIS